MSFTLRSRQPELRQLSECSKMNFEEKHQPWRMCLLFVALLYLGLASSALAAEVKSALSRESTVVGEPVRLEIRIEGGRASAPPRDIEVDGLSINYMGTSQSHQITFNNGSIRAINEVTYSYQVVPERAGVFTIPALEVDADGKVAKTQPVTLRVQNDRGRGGAAGGDERPMTRVGFAEITLPKKTAYVGEALPVEVRLFVDSAVNWEPETMPTLEGDGFTKSKIGEPHRESARRDGRDYTVLVFQIVITPSKAGKVMIGPAELSFHAQIPRAKPNNGRSGSNSFFGNDIFNDPFSVFSAVERRTAKAGAVELDVKPLPSAGKPASFSGAVGKFTFTAEGTPKTVKVGDPLTMTLTVSGQGTFDRMGEPVLVDKSGWRTYPASSNFQPEDDSSMRGHKTFQVAVIPETKKTEMPKFEFSYFDPETEKYVTRTSEAAPLTVEGGKAAPAPAPVPVRSTPVQSAEKPSSPEAEKPAPMADILGLRYDAGRKASFTPVYEKPAFWLAQLVPLTALLGLFATRLKRSNAEARTVAKLRRERSAQLARLQREKSRAEFLDAAARTIQLDTALVTGQMPGTVDAAEACRSRQLDSGTMASVQEIFDSRAELLYAGDGHGKESVSPAERERVLATVEQFEKSHGRN